MKKIQVIGLPGSGKTFAIDMYKESDSSLSYLDIRNYSSQSNFARAIRIEPNNTIAESACGINISGTYIVKLIIDANQLCNNLTYRGDKISSRHLSYLKDQMLPANYTVSSSYDLKEVLSKIFQGA